MSDKIKVTLSPTALEVNAGESVELTATIHNRSQVVDQFTIALEGLAPAWYGFSVASVSLFPGDKAQVRITIHPPKTAETKAGSYPFTVSAVSGADPQQSTAAEASVEVRTFAGLAVDMSPTRIVGQSGTYVITLNNQGNAEATHSFEASDSEEGLNYTFKPQEVTVPAGGSATVELVAKLKKKPKIDGEKEYPFQVVAKPSGADKFSTEAKTLNGQLVYEHKARPKPKIPRWLIGVLAGVAVAIIVILLLRGCAGPPQIIEFAFNYTPTEQGYELHWVVKNAAEGYINGEALEDAQLKEGEMMADPAITTVYVLNATNRAGAANATVIIPPLISFRADWLGCEFGLSWTVKGADQVYLDGEAVSPDGDKTVSPPEPVGYNLTARNEGGAAEKILTVAPPAVTVVSPDGGEELAIGSQHSVSWTSTEPQRDGSGVTDGIHHVGLEYSIDEGDTWRTVDTDEPDDGNYPWTIPNTPSTRCLVRATIYCAEGDILGQDTSDDFFTIAGECTVYLLTPYEGVVIYPDGKYNVTWEAEGVSIHHVELSYRVGTGSWQIIKTSLANTGSYSWTLPAFNSAASCSLRIRIYDSEGNILCEDINGPFTIRAQEITCQCTVDLLTPDEGDVLLTNASPPRRYITWTSTGTCIDHVELSYRVGTGSWEPIESLSDTGQYPWYYPTEQLGSCELRIRIYDSAGNLLCADINGPFTIEYLPIPCGCTVDLQTPTAGENVYVGDTYEVEWYSEGTCIDHVELSYRRLPEGTWQTIAPHLDNTGSYDWPVSSLVSALSIPPVGPPLGPFGEEEEEEEEEYEMRIRIYDSAGNLLCADINGPFTIGIEEEEELQEDCIDFDYNDAEVKEVDGRWKIVVGSIWLLDFDDNESEARQALQIIKHYRMNKLCFVGRPDPSMEYYLVDGQSPAGAFEGEDCVSFNPANIEVKEIGGRWKIVEGSHAILDFEDKENEARLSFEIIKNYGFEYICFVGRPDPSMMYFRRA